MADTCTVTACNYIIKKKMRVQKLLQKASKIYLLIHRLRRSQRKR